MKFVVLFGPPAVGKMTIGYELSKLSTYPLFHNHMSIELVLNYFDFGHPKFSKLVGDFRQRIFEEVATSDLSGLIFTIVWALDEPEDKEEMDKWTKLFSDQGARIYFVELAAEQEIRLARNRTAFRLEQKPSKRDLVRSEKSLRGSDSSYRLNSNGDFFYPDQHLKIETDQLSAEETAAIIWEWLNKE